MKNYLIMFFTHSGAIKFQRTLKNSDVSCTLMPVPRALSSNCGIGAKVSYEENILEFVNNEVEKVFEVENEQYKIIYQEE